MGLKAFRMRLKIRSPTVKLCFMVKQHACHGKLSRHICLQGAQLWMPCSPALPEVIITVVSPLCPVTDSICHLRQVTTTCSTAQVGTFHDPYDTFTLSSILKYRNTININHSIKRPNYDRRDLFEWFFFFLLIFNLRYEHWHFSCSKFYAAQKALRDRTSSLIFYGWLPFDTISFLWLRNNRQ